MSFAGMVDLSGTFVLPGGIVSSPLDRVDSGVKQDGFVIWTHYCPGVDDPSFRYSSFTGKHVRDFSPWVGYGSSSDAAAANFQEQIACSRRDEAAEIARRNNRHTAMHI